MSRHQRELKVAWHHADHFIGLAVQQDLRSQYALITVQATLPERVTDHRDLLLLFIFLLRKESALEWFDLQCGKHPAGESSAIHLRWLTNAR